MVRSALVAGAGEPSSLMNWLFHLCTLRSIEPPSPSLKTLMVSSASPALVPRVGTEYCSVRNCPIGTCHCHDDGLGMRSPATSISFGSESAVESVCVGELHDCTTPVLAAVLAAVLLAGTGAVGALGALAESSQALANTTIISAMHQRASRRHSSLCMELTSSNFQA